MIFEKPLMLQGASFWRSRLHLYDCMIYDRGHCWGEAVASLGWWHTCAHPKSKCLQANKNVKRNIISALLLFWILLNWLIKILHLHLTLMKYLWVYLKSCLDFVNVWCLFFIFYLWSNFFFKLKSWFRPYYSSTPTL